MRKLTKEQKTIRGTYDRSKEKPKMTLEPLEKIPEPLFPLGEVETGYFTHCAKIMIQNKTLTAADVPGLTRAASWYGIYTKALDDIATHGCYQVAASGYSTKNGFFQVLSEAEKFLSSFETKAGLNLVSRSKLPEPKPPQAPDPLDFI